jgi:hypothetical protein
MELTMQNTLMEYSPNTELLEQENFEWGHESSPGVLGETLEMELAAELLEVKDEQELDRFLGKLISSVGRGLGKLVRSPIFKSVGGVLKGIAKTALPLAGGALGTFVGGPLGASIGSNLASMAGNALGLELEGLSQEDREFEAARQFVRFASEAVKNAAGSPSPDVISAAQAGAMQAARKFAPGLLDGLQTPQRAPAYRHTSGRWSRHGRNIIIVNC